MNASVVLPTAFATRTECGRTKRVKGGLNSLGKLTHTKRLTLIWSYAAAVLKDYTTNRRDKYIGHNITLIINSPDVNFINLTVVNKNVN